MKTFASVESAIVLASIIGAAAVCGIAGCGGEGGSAPGWWGRLVERAEEALQARTGVRLLAPDGDDPGALVWVHIADAEAEGISPMPPRLTLLVHGLDEPGSVWDELAADLRAGGWSPARFDYPNAQRLTDSAEFFFDSLRELRAAGVERLDLVCHSMGGLIARDVLTREGMYGGAAAGHEDLPDIERLVLVGTPHEGSAMAPLRIFAEVREHVARWLDRSGRDRKALLSFMVDGDGAAGRDLAQGSEYLKDLNARERPKGVEITLVVGRVAELDATGRRRLAQIGGERLAATVEGLLEQVGDGVVPVESALWAGADEVVFVAGAHRSMLRRFELEQSVRRLLGKDVGRGDAVGAVLEALSDTRE